MELTWPLRIRIAAAAAIGILLVGILPWSLIAPNDPFAALSLLSGQISVVDGLIMGILAFSAGLIAYFVAWPYGREIGILAVPAGLAVIAVRAGSMTDLVERNVDAAARMQLLKSLRFEPVFWFAFAAIGFAAVLAASRLFPVPQVTERRMPEEPPQKGLMGLLAGIAGSLALAELFIGFLAQDVRYDDPAIGSVLGQPAVAQIAFALIVSFGLAAFLAKKYLRVDYIGPSIATALVTLVIISLYIKAQAVERLADFWPADFYLRATTAVLPVQMVAFGSLGAVAGYWLAIRFDFWHKYESKGASTTAR